MQLSTVTAVVTGGCSGLGLATAQYLSSLGANIALFDINPAASEQALASLNSNKAIFCEVDVRSEHSIRAAVELTNRTFGAIHACVNCAGIAPAQRTLSKEGEAVKLETFQNTININLVGSFNVASIIAEAMAKNVAADSGDRGVIINTASIAGYEGQIGQTAYAASKAGIIGYTLPMARDLAPLGIRVNTIAPGIMATPLLLAMPDNVQQALSSNVPYPKRLGLPLEFAKLVAHIIENGYLNGETIRLDGALRMPPK